MVDKNLKPFTTKTDIILKIIDDKLKSRKDLRNGPDDNTTQKITT